MTSATLDAGLRSRLAARHVGAALAVLTWLAVAVLLQQAGAARVWLLLLAAPVLEEAAFRAGLHEALLARRCSPAAANVLTALGFAGLHVAVQAHWQAGLVCLPALLVGAVYNRWRRLRWCVLLHAGMNAAWLAMTLMNRAA